MQPLMTAFLAIRCSTSLGVPQDEHLGSGIWEQVRDSTLIGPRGVCMRGGRWTELD